MTALRITIAIGAVLALGCSDGGSRDGASGCTHGQTGCTDAGPDWLAVVSNVALDETCNYDLSKKLASIPVGQFDVAASSGEHDGCKHPYLAHLLFSSNSYLYDGVQRVFQNFDISLLTADGKVIAFDDALPNPFRQTLTVPLDARNPDELSKGIANVVLIPAEYRDAMKPFVGQKVLASLGLPAATPTKEPGKDTFTYPIAICDGCLTSCASHASSTNAGTCADMTGADGRICVDPDC